MRFHGLPFVIWPSVTSCSEAKNHLEKLLQFMTETQVWMAPVHFYADFFFPVSTVSRLVVSMGFASVASTRLGSKIVLWIHSWEPWMQEAHCMRRSLSLCIRDLSIRRFQCPRRVLDPMPTDTEGPAIFKF